MPAVIPRPTMMESGEGFFSLTADSVIVSDAASRQTAGQLAEYLRPATGFALTIGPGDQRAGSSIVLSQDKGLAELGAEGYQLAVTLEKVSLSAPTQAGLFYAVQTLRQLLPPEIFSVGVVNHVSWKAPCVAIRDAPRFGWRGLMLDTGHDFQPLSAVLHFIDLMAIHKFNTFHWHITDLGTWPLEIKNYPRLLDPATHEASIWEGRGVKDGYYTQEEARQVVRYAAERHITVLPEIDMPGHSNPALIAYPELDCPVPHKMGSWDHFEYCLSNTKTYEFLEEVLSQLIEIFPSQLVHTGGDEVPVDHWKKCPLCQARMKADALKDERELQTCFTRRIGKFLSDRSRRMVLWYETFEGVPPGTVVMSWRDMDAGIVSAKAGYDVVMAPASHTYFDYAHATTPLEKVYRFEPVPKELTPQEARHILGAQAQMWSDARPTESMIEYLVYPRACALSEVVWSPADGRDYKDFVKRLTVHERRMAAMGINYRPLSEG